MSEKINNLEELRREKELIKLKMKITQQAFFHSVGENRRHVQRLVINKIALPVGASALASLLVQFLAKKTRSEEEVMEAGLNAEEKHSYWWIPIVRTVMQFLENYLNLLDSTPSDGAPSANGHVIHPINRQENP